MNSNDHQIILTRAAEWFHTTIITNHIKNTRKLVSSREFDINPFLVSYLATFFADTVDAKALACALLYPRVLGTSITTSFGTHMQNFISTVLDSYGSTTSGIDIEFIDTKDKRRKYCQIKLGPNTINKDDVKTIHDHFKAVRNLGRTNGVAIAADDMVVAILYGERGQESTHYKSLTREYGYPVYIGTEFWTHLTGDDRFYAALIQSIVAVATKIDVAGILAETVDALAKTPEIQSLAEADLERNKVQVRSNM